MTKAMAQRHDRAMKLPATLAWLVDLAAETAGSDHLLAGLGAHLIADGLPLAGGALTLEVPHPLIAKRTWLWRAASGELIEALGFAPGGPPTLLLTDAANTIPAEDAPANNAGRQWLAGPRSAPGSPPAAAIANRSM